MQIITKLKGLNVRGASHHFLLPILAILIVAGIGGFIMQRSSSAATVFRTAGGKTCKQRTFALNSKSTCVGYAQKMMGLSGNNVDGAFGPITRNKLKAVTGSTVLNSSSWAKLCNNNKGKTVWKQAGCGGQGVDTYRSKPANTKDNTNYRYGYFNCYPKSKVYPSKPKWACERKWVKKTDTVKINGTYAIKSAQANVKKRHTQFGRDLNAYNYTNNYMKVVKREREILKTSAPDNVKGYSRKSIDNAKRTLANRCGVGYSLTWKANYAAVCKARAV